MRKLFALSAQGGHGAESTVYERHASELLADMNYAKLLQKDLDGGEAGQLSLEAQKALLDAKLKQALDFARQQLSEVTNGQMDSKVNLNDLLSDLAANGASGEKQRGTRFSHATEFGQEKTGNVGSSTVNGAQLLANRFGDLSAELDREDEASLKARLEREEQEREEELEALARAVEATNQQLATLDRTKGDSLTRIRQLESELERLQALGEAMEKEILIKKKTLELLPNATANIEKLQGICAASSARLQQLAQEWEVHRQPLIDKIRTVQNTSSDRRARCKAMMDEMQSCKAEMTDMIADLKEKQLRAAQLAEELSHLPKNINRAIYTHRIMEIIGNIHKQNLEIDKITNDIRIIQKTINTTAATLARSDAITEETIYAAASDPKSDASVVDTYRGLTSLRAQFDRLTECASLIGIQEKSSRDLEVKIEQETTRVTHNNFDRIKADLKAVRAENASLVQQLKSM